MCSASRSDRLVGFIIHETYGPAKSALGSTAIRKICSLIRARSAAQPRARPCTSKMTTGMRCGRGGVGEIYARNTAWPDFTYRK